MRALPYGLPKVMVSTIASGNVAPWVDIKDITMVFSVADILGLNPLTRKILANAAGAVCGMASVKEQLQPGQQASGCGNHSGNHHSRCDESGPSPGGRRL